jgi:hypothetical protein
MGGSNVVGIVMGFLSSHPLVKLMNLTRHIDFVIYITA